MKKLENMKTIAFDIKESVFDNDIEAIMYITHDIYTDYFVIAIPVLAFSWHISMDRDDRDYQELLRSNMLDIKVHKEKLIQAIKEATALFD